MIGNKRKNTNCASLRYQPFKFWSYQHSQCVFSKSRCNEIGQIVSALGSTYGDRICRCDHEQGYAFLTLPKHHCYCTPSIEDCTCYRKTCPVNNTLMSGMKYILLEISISFKGRQKHITISFQSNHQCIPKRCHDTTMAVKHTYFFLRNQSRKYKKKNYHNRKITKKNNSIQFIIPILSLFDFKRL